MVDNMSNSTPSSSVKEWEWLVPFNGRNDSGAVEQNFLCRSENVYVMDNHRAALWCWLQELDLNKPHSLIHIDRHYDALDDYVHYNDTTKLWLKNLGQTTKVIDFLNKSFDDPNRKIITWDTYIPIYLHEFGKNFTTFRCLTHKDGVKPNCKRIKYDNLWDLPEKLVDWLTRNKENKPWIVNIDLDYFYCNFKESEVRMMVSDDYIDAVGSSLRIAMDQGFIGVLTLCLTPGSPYTPGWPETEVLAARLLKHLRLTFALPNSPP